MRRPSPALVVASTALVAALGGAAYASIPAPDGSVHSCVGNRGTVRVIDSAASCDPGEQALNFSQTGPQGKAGPPGQSRLLNFAADGSVKVPRKAGAPIGSFDLPEGTWEVTFTGGVKIPGSSPVTLNFGKGKRLSAAALNAYRAVAAGPAVACKLSLGDGSVRQAMGDGQLIGLLLPAVKTQHGAGGGGGTGRVETAAFHLQLLAHVPAGGERGFLACNQGKSKPGFASPSAQLQDISVRALQIDQVDALNFTPAK
jgi:hypothetical protein